MNKNEPIKASDARQQWKELLDRAANGEVIKIIRAGVVFYLGTSGGMDAGMNRVVDSVMKLGEHIATHKENNVQKRTDVQKRTNTNTNTKVFRRDRSAAALMGVSKNKPKENPIAKDVAPKPPWVPGPERDDEDMYQRKARLRLERPKGYVCEHGRDIDCCPNIACVNNPNE